MSVLSIKRPVSTQPSIINDHAGVSNDAEINICEKEAAVLMLHDNGMIRSCNQAGGELFGNSNSELTGQHINRLLPQLAEIKLVQDKQANSYLRFLSRIGHRFEAVRMSGASFTCELFFNDVEYHGQHYLRVIICLVR